MTANGLRAEDRDRDRESAAASPVAGDEQRRESAGEAHGARTADAPEAFESLVQRGAEAMRARRLEEALELFERALALRSDDPEALYGAGTVYGLRALERLRENPSLLEDRTPAESDLAKAILSYQRVAELDPGFFEALNNLATLYTIIGDRELAVDAFKRSLEASPDQPEVRERLEELGAF